MSWIQLENNSDYLLINIPFPARPNSMCNLTNSSEAKSGNKEVAGEANNDTKLLEVKPPINIGNESVNTRRKELNTSQNESNTNVNSSTLIPLTEPTTVTLEIVPTTLANTATNSVGNSTIKMRANDNSTGTESATVSVVIVTDSNSTTVSNTIEDSNSTATR